MSIESETHRLKLEARLREVEDTFANAMRARGFDLSQSPNLALPGYLANLYAEREQLRSELDELGEEP
jgi:hypothetical protein